MTNLTYIVTIAAIELTLTNCIEIKPNHAPPSQCTLIRYIKDGRTNEFHAWLVDYTVTTNKSKEK